MSRANDTCLSKTHNALTHPTTTRLTLVFAQSFGFSLYAMLQKGGDPLWHHQSLCNKLLLSTLIAGLATMTYSHSHSAVQTHREQPDHGAKKIAHLSTAITGIAMIAFAIQRLCSNSNAVTMAQSATLLTGMAGFVTQALAHSKHLSQHEQGHYTDRIHQAFNIGSGLLGLGFAAFVIMKAAGFNLAEAISIGNDSLHSATKIAGMAGLGIAMLLNIVDSMQRHCVGTSRPLAEEADQGTTNLGLLV